MRLSVFGTCYFSFRARPRPHPHPHPHHHKVKACSGIYAYACVRFHWSPGSAVLGAMQTVTMRCRGVAVSRCVCVATPDVHPESAYSHDTGGRSTNGAPAKSVV